MKIILPMIMRRKKISDKKRNILIDIFNYIRASINLNLLLFESVNITLSRVITVNL